MTNETTSATADNDNEATLASGLGGLPVTEQDVAYLTHLKAIDIPAWQYRRGDWFTLKLFSLMTKADETNFWRLAEVFPMEAQAFKWWQSGAWERAERAKENTT